MEKLNESDPPGRAFRLFLLSLFLHALLFGVYWILEPYFTTPEPSPPPPPLATRIVSPSEFAQIEMQDKRNRVDSAKAAQSLAVKERARYLGEKTQRVQKETRVQGFGAVAAPPPSAPQSSPAKPTPKQSPADNPAEKLKKLGFSSGISKMVLDKKTLREKPSTAAENSTSRSLLRRGTMDKLDSDIAIGTQTLLNTDEYVYASFFNRVKIEVGARWEPLIAATLSDRRSRISPGTYKTQTVFTLDAEGEVIDVEIKSASGVRAFDEAARTALLQLLRVKNPPKALQEEDGHYRIELGFIVEENNAVAGFRTDYEPDPRLLPPGR